MLSFSPLPKKTIFYLLFWTLCISTNASAQSIEIKLSDKYGKSNVYSYHVGTGRNNDYQKYRNLDTLKYQRWALRSISFNPIQTLKEWVINGKMRQRDFVEHIKQTNIDTSHISQNAIQLNQAAVFVGFNHSGHKIVIVDTNNNNDFGDEIEHTFDLDSAKKYPVSHVRFDYLKGDQIVPVVIPLTINAYEDINSVNVDFMKEFYQEGYIQKGSESYLVQISDEYYGLYTDVPFKINVSKVPLDTATSFRNIHDSTEQLRVGDQDIYQVRALSRDVLQMDFVKKSEHSGAKINTLAPDIRSVSFKDGQEFDLLTLRGKYVVVNFWGTWCAPCIEEIPTLRLLRDKFAGKGVEMLSIAFEKESDLGQLDRVIRERKMNWEHLLSIKSAKEGIVKDYSVNIFPTTLLIDPAGMIILRGEGKGVLSQIDLFLTSKLF